MSGVGEGQRHRQRHPLTARIAHTGCSKPPRHDITPPPPGGLPFTRSTRSPSRSVWYPSACVLYANILYTPVKGLPGGGAAFHQARRSNGTDPAERVKSEPINKEPETWPCLQTTAERLRVGILKHCDGFFFFFFFIFFQGRFFFFPSRQVVAAGCCDGFSSCAGYRAQCTVFTRAVWTHGRNGAKPGLVLGAWSCT